MAIGLGASDSDSDEFVAAINTTPLVDVMLVLLIIFLITVPVAIETMPVSLPREEAQPMQAEPHDISITIDRNGVIYWNKVRLADDAALRQELAASAAAHPPPLIEISADRAVHYAAVGRVVADCRRANIAKLAFVMAPPKTRDEK